MDNDKILEIARCYGTENRKWVPVLEDGKEVGIVRRMAVWEFAEENLIAFAQSVIEESRDTTTIKVPTVVWDKLKDVNTVTDLIKALKVAEEEE